ncbi:antibiotic resistance protein VanZ [Streptomonospora nanhaiensis]|uniref:Antibiotic resistance protein VanZ n=1 Tax=Streptomonospora nanhaiensis TaxID=1323731 RepID=A0ABY6YK69_9ACTN|nr:antibiotic resistance protein VanZ [Streptomonospora nanhaiensis]WAE72601.1 antibiotic resistance protein VanZ [Streptomonospora nanhaiensis]
MGRPFGGGQAAVEVALAVVPLLVVAGAALYLRGQHRRYGRPHGLPGRLTTAALVTGVALAAYAVWPLPASADGLCTGNGSAGSGPPHTAWDAALALGLFTAVGLLARHRFRRGAVETLVIGAALAASVAAVRATGVLGLYPCAYAPASALLVALGVVGTLAGWTAARRLLPLWPGGPARGWPAAVPDRVDPALDRRMTGALIDLGLWWFGASAVTALLHAYGVVLPLAGGRTGEVALLGLALVCAVLLPQLRSDRATPGPAAVGLALGERGSPRPASRWRVLLRTLLLQAPVAVLVALGLPWAALAVAALHACTALVRPDRAGLADLVCGVRVRTRSSLDGGLPSQLVRYSEPRAQARAGASAGPARPPREPV